MKKILFSILAGAMTLSASAQSSFTVTSNGKEYSFPITHLLQLPIRNSGNRRSWKLNVSSSLTIKQ